MLEFSAELARQPDALLLGKVSPVISADQATPALDPKQPERSDRSSHQSVIQYSDTYYSLSEAPAG